jgi:lambda family phage portal protein
MNGSAPRILGADGLPVSPARARRLASNVPYAAGDPSSQEMDGWSPWLGSADSEVNPWRNPIVARIRDMVRNDGWAAGSVTRLVDAAVGADLRPVPRPDFRSLSWWTSGFDAVWAAEFASWAKGCWRDWAHDPARWCDLRRRHTIPEMFALAFRSMLVDGDATAVCSWRPDRMSAGRGLYATTIGLIDSDRLSNPQDRMDDQRMRGGVEIDADGAAVAYHFRDGHPGEFYANASAYTWRRWVRETSWGRPVVIHHFEADRIDQHRGVGMLAPVLARLKMLNRYDSVELQAAVVNAILAAYITSPFDADLVQDALNPEAGLPAYQQLRADFHKQNAIRLGGVRLPILAPGENIVSVAPNRPSSNYSSFQAAFLRNLAVVTGQSEMEVSADWSRTNYSSARAALLTTWKTVIRRRRNFAGGFAQPVFAAFLEEAMERDRPPLPAGAPDFAEARAAYSRADWRGPGRGWVDPVKEPAGAQLRMEAGLSTLDAECAEAGGLDYEEVLDQRAIEIEAFRSRGLPLPTWTGAVAAAAAGAGDQPPPRQP